MEESTPTKEQTRPHRSVSQLTSYARCSEAYRLERIAQAPQLPAAWSIGGSAVHHGIELWEKSGRSMPATEVEDAVVIDYRNRANELLEEWDLGHFLTGGAKSAEDDLTDREDKAVYQVHDYMTWARSQEHLWGVEDSEVEFHVELGGVKVRGFIDQVLRHLDGSLGVRDLKSGTKVPASNVQLATYAVAVRTLYEEDVTTADFLQLGNPKGRSELAKHVRIHEVDVANDAAFDPEFLAQFYRDADRGITSGVFVPAPNDGCSRVCAVAQWCRDQGHRESARQYTGGLLVESV